MENLSFHIDSKKIAQLFIEFQGEKKNGMIEQADVMEACRLNGMLKGETVELCLLYERTDIESLCGLHRD